jgi:tetratricopeptide (TPR) repeat protein
VTSSPERSARNEQRKAHIAEYYGANPKGEPSRLLREAIGTAQYRKRVREMEKLHDPIGYMSLQKEILFAVNRHVARYQTRMIDENARPASHRLGCPSYVIQNKDASCFSGPWLMAALMEDAGINPERIFYCNVQRAKNGTIGGHGTLVCTTGGVGINSFSEVLFADHGLMMTGKNLPIHVCGDEKTYRAVQGLFTHKHTDMVQLEFPERMHRIFDIHPNMQIMPLYQGLTTGHLLHTGIAFLHEGKLDEAEHSFELGLTYNPKDPDLLYYLGIIHFMQNESSEAYGAFTRALDVFADHVQSRYSLGELHCSQGDARSAKEAFTRVAAVKKEDIWGETEFYDRAVAFSRMDDNALLQEGKELFNKIVCYGKNNVITATRQDNASIAEFGLLEKVRYFTEIEDQNTLNKNAEALLAFHKPT